MRFEMGAQGRNAIAVTTDPHTLYFLMYMVARSLLRDTKDLEHYHDRDVRMWRYKVDNAIQQADLLFGLVRDIVSKRPLLEAPYEGSLLTTIHALTGFEEWRRHSYRETINSNGDPWRLDHFFSEPDYTVHKAECITVIQTRAIPTPSP